MAVKLSPGLKKDLEVGRHKGMFSSHSIIRSCEPAFRTGTIKRKYHHADMFVADRCWQLFQPLVTCSWMLGGAATEGVSASPMVLKSITFIYCDVKQS